MCVCMCGDGGGGAVLRVPPMSYHIAARVIFGKLKQLTGPSSYYSDFLEDEKAKALAWSGPRIIDSLDCLLIIGPLCHS